jgi:hypothetical protein
MAELRSRRPVNGLTHQYYRYPARFSPDFARSVIEKFSKPGDTILDPFMGGGTTIVEALTSGRHAIGVDLNPIALFVSRVKTTPLSASEICEAEDFAAYITTLTVSFAVSDVLGTSDPLFTNVPWWLRRTVLRIRNRIERLTDGYVRDFLRCGLLRTAQWALDGRQLLPGSNDFAVQFGEDVLAMCADMKVFREALKSVGIRTRSECLSRRRLLLLDSADLDSRRCLPVSWDPIRLVLTSPPYPGIHVLYNRWQVGGRRETRAPFLIMNEPDGYYASHLTFGDRRQPDGYFDRLAKVYRAVERLLSRKALVVQLVSFANSRRDVPRYLRTMHGAGFIECRPHDLGLKRQRRLRRVIPNRKWYVRCSSDAPKSNEVLLVHRRAPR